MGTAPSLDETSLDADISTLLTFGLGAADFELLWRQTDVVDQEQRRVFRGMVPSRIPKESAADGSEGGGENGGGDGRVDGTTYGGGGGGSSPGGAAHALHQLATALRDELGDPPDRFLDPVMLCLMQDPVVMSSGHVADRATVQDATTGALRFHRCPMSRQPLEPRVYPLHSLKSEIIDYRLRRTDDILTTLPQRPYLFSECQVSALSLPFLT